MNITGSTLRRTFWTSIGVAVVGGTIAYNLVKHNPQPVKETLPSQIDSMVDVASQAKLDPAYQTLRHQFLQSGLYQSLVRYTLPNGNVTTIRFAKYEKNGLPMISALCMRDTDGNGVPDAELDLEHAVEINLHLLVGSTNQNQRIVIGPEYSPIGQQINGYHPKQNVPVASQTP